jgi:hypothetical protein
VHQVNKGTDHRSSMHIRRFHLLLVNLIPLFRFLTNGRVLNI